MKLVALITALVLSSAVAQAQTQTPAPGQRGSSDEQEACERDATRFCPKVLSDGDFAVLRCLQENRAKISRACHAVLVKYGQ
jgi:cysteine rich repeat protein